MNANSKEVTAPADTQDAITDRYEVETNIVSEPAKVEPAKEVKPEPKSDSQTEPSEEPQESKTINPRTQARKAEKERLLRENAAMAEKLKQYEASQAKPSSEPAKRDPSQEPKIEDFEDALEFMEAKIEHKLYKQKESEKQNLQQEAKQKQIEAYTETVEAFREQKPDFDEKVGALVESGLISPEIEDAVLSSDMKAAVSYHLAQHGGDLLTLRGLPKELLPKAIKAIEAFIQKGGAQQEKPRVTQASPPITPPGNSAKTNRDISSYSQEEIENMPLAEFNKLLKRK